MHLVGPRGAEDLPAFYSAADVYLMASHREGMPNVVLEALACGTPEAGVAVGGVPEVVTDPIAGSLVASNSPADLRTALRTTLDAPRDRDAIRHFASRYSWSATTEGQLALFRAAKASN